MSSARRPSAATGKASPAATGNAPLRPARLDRQGRPRHPHAGLVGGPDADTVLFPVRRDASKVDGGHFDSARLERLDRTLPFSAVSLLESQLRPPQASRRRTIVSRCVLVAILGCQALLSLSLHNTASQEEAQYLYGGHMVLMHWLHGSAEQGTYASYFPGSPALYPVLAATIAQIGGLAAARAFSLAEMLIVTSLLYSLTRQLFNERAGLCAAAVFSVAEATILMGRLATIDACSLCLLALAAWMAVRTSSWSSRAYLLAGPVAALAVAVSYLAIIFLPAVAILAGLSALPYGRRDALARPLTLGGLSVGLVALAGALAGQSYLAGFRQVFAASSPASPVTILADSGRWAGIPLALAMIGTVGYARRARTEAGELVAPPGDATRRAWLGACLVATALVPTVEQMALGSNAQLDTLIGFGLFFAGPMAGLGLVRLVGDHFRRPQLGIAAWAVALTLGLGQAGQLFTSWPGSTALVSHLSRYLSPGARYLVEDDDVPIYYLSGHADAQPDQFTSTYFFAFSPARGHALAGAPAYLAAIKAGYFKLIEYDSTFTPALDKELAAALETSSKYRLAEVVTESAAHARATAYIWVRI
jgi:Dolichyl-phosphate-mannose-protein mannosyltransferase